VSNSIKGAGCDFDGLPFAALVVREAGEKLYLSGPCCRDKYPTVRLSEDQDEVIKGR
jgi:hypothetical protein